MCAWYTWDEVPLPCSAWVAKRAVGSSSCRAASAHERLKALSFARSDVAKPSLGTQFSGEVSDKHKAAGFHSPDKHVVDQVGCLVRPYHLVSWQHP